MLLGGWDRRIFWRRGGRRTDLYGIDKFTYVPEQNCYVCPERKQLKYIGILEVLPDQALDFVIPSSNVPVLASRA